MITPILLVSLCSIICFFIFSHFATASHGPNEPRLIPSRIPFFGHLPGMIRHGSSYYGMIAKKHNLPIFTLGVPKSKIYIVTSPQLISAIDRRSKTISFAPYVVQFAKRMLKPSQHAIEKLGENLLEEKGPVGLRPETLKAMHDSLVPGPNLDAISKVMLRGISTYLDPASVQESSGSGRIRLFEWTRRFVTRASTDAVYGPEKNPFHDPEVYDAFWTIDEQFILLGLNVLPGLITPRGSRARKLFFDAMHRYYSEDGPSTASALIRSRHAVSLQHGLSQTDMEHFNLSVSYGLLVNTVPTAAWVLYHVYSDESLLASLRRDIGAFVRREEEATASINLPEVIAGCRLLDSLVREVLRVHSTNASGRVVLRDTLIDDRYMLKEGATLLTPSAELHRNADVWGPTASAFDAGRFLGQKKVPGSAYRAFGSGASVCPGRFFATNEISAILVMMLPRYDVSPAHGRSWVVPKTKSHITTSIMTPVEDIEVRITEREEAKGVKWTFTWEAEEEKRQD
ncbi:unnamed protein product [Clonostachys solani]|uniref:25-hydroxycholesterol 7-alpha-hydroxylase n=1 Tax=Clonostachys solani TaxID=160281 RepID=A0A9N9W0I2_9HYPO|nr:unnamed protein product [Clonostachys solani]